MSDTEKHAFQAEVQQLLDIVIHSLYTDKEIFIRELISNAADACEKLRFTRSAGAEVHEPDIEPKISIATDDTAKTIAITDTGIGMTRDELVENLGTIAHSGSKAFLKQLSEQKEKPDANLIGQFGVGFYSAFMVAKEVKVLTRSFKPDAPGHLWTSTGQGSYEIESAPDWNRGTRILVELKEDDKAFAQASHVESIIKRYSNFVSFPIELNGEKVNTISAIWARSKSDIKDEEYKEFYQFIGHDHEEPLGRLHFSADAPLAIQALLFVPSKNIENMELGRSDSEVNLYCRKILIEPKAKKLFPDWLRFLKGVVDSEDLPLNISRESMQDSSLMQKLNKIITTRFIKFLHELSKKDAEQFNKIYDEYQRFLKEGVISDFTHREALGKLLRYETSALAKGEKTSLSEYVQRMGGDQKEIYFIFAPSRETAESSPYYEPFQSKGQEVLFVYDPWDEMVMENLGRFEEKSICAAERAEIKIDSPEGEALTDEQVEELGKWLKENLGEQVDQVKASKRLVGSPAVVVDADKTMTANMRRLMKALNQDSGTTKYNLEINPRHEVIKRLHAMKSADEELAKSAAAQLFDNARMAAGVVDDPRELVNRLNSLLEKVLAAK
ncbi:MAG: Chaperone protein HtpG [Verrucomicrobia subdivision 3 bacterium]|nr:Chaperone protein HtpG [Limisphaerales bacterium]MCS1417641.1 Chaperone protein HtpG [Limisphaerales bacterium]